MGTIRQRTAILLTAICVCVGAAACGSGSHTRSRTAASVPHAKAQTTSSAATTAALPPSATTTTAAPDAPVVSHVVRPAALRKVQALLQGVSESGTTLGDENAKVTVTYYGDLQCPICAQFSSGKAFAKLLHGPVADGTAKVTFEAFCTATCNDGSAAQFRTQQVAALAAGQQGLFWIYALLFLRSQRAEGSGYVTASFLNGIAAATPGLNVTEWSAARTDPALATQVTSETKAAARQGVNATPTLVVSGPGGHHRLEGIPAAGALLSAIRHAE